MQRPLHLIFFAKPYNQNNSTTTKTTTTTTTTTTTKTGPIAKMQEQQDQPMQKQYTEEKQQSNSEQDDVQGKLSDLQVLLEQAQQQIRQEKAGKRKIFHSLVKLANELKRTRQESTPLLEAKQFANQPWYEGGMWRNQVQVLPGVARAETKGQARVRGGEAVSLSDLFLDLVIVTAFTRVGQAISNMQSINAATVLYFGIFWTIWSKEASYSSRFDTTDLSAKVETLLTCFAVLFGSLSANAPINSVGGTRIMMVAAFCAILHCLLHLRIAIVFSREESVEQAIFSQEPISRQSTRTVSRAQETRRHVQSYALFNVVMTLVESLVWLIGIFAVPVEAPFRWVVFLVGLLCALRVPRAFLANDFHGKHLSS